MSSLYTSSCTASLSYISLEYISSLKMAHIQQSCAHVGTIGIITAVLMLRSEEGSPPDSFCETHGQVKVDHAHIELAMNGAQFHGKEQDGEGRRNYQ